MNRRDFITALGASAATAAFARPVRSLVGSNGGSYVESAMPTASDYVQDGLVAMFDGIENAGWGLHDDAVTTPYELVSGQTDIGIRSTFVANEDNLEVEIGNSSVVTPSVFAGASANAVQDGFLHVEGIFFIDAIEAHIYGNYIGFFGGSFGWQYRTGQGGLSMLNFGWMVAKDTSTVNADKVRLAFDVDAENSTIQYHVGSQASPIKSITVPSSIRPVAHFGSVGTRLYSMRAYNRPLTADEKSHNNQIDKWRFGI